MLPAGSYAVLGLLSFGRELSGYDLKQWADHSLQYFFGSPAQSAIYTELRRLEELGYAAPVGSTEGPRGRQRFAITAAGRSALSDWVARSVTPPTATKDHALLKVWLGHVISASELQAVVAAERRVADEQLAAVRFSAEQASTLDLGYAALVERFCERLAVARVEALAELADALAESPVPVGTGSDGDRSDGTRSDSTRSSSTGQRSQG